MAWAGPLTACLAVGSIVICVLGLPETAAGIAVNLAILAVLATLALRGARRVAPLA